MQERLKTFWFIESIGGLAWIYMYLVWILGIEFFAVAIIPLAMTAIFFSLASLFYATTRLDRGSFPLTAIVAGNLWVAADSLWAISDFYEIGILLTIGKILTVSLVATATYEFMTSRDNMYKLKNFAEFFRKFRNS